MKDNKMLFLIISIILIVIILIYGYYSFMGDKIKYLDKNKNIIYDIGSNNYQSVPYINLKGKEIADANKEIDDFLSKYMDVEDVLIKYKYERYGAILSLIISVSDYNTVDTPEVLFKSYNIDLSNNHVLDNKEVLDIFDLDLNMLKKMSYDIFYIYYNQSTISEYCDVNCFRKDLDGYFSYFSDINLFIENDKLYIYVSAHEKMDYIEYEYFLNHNFNWEVGEVYD